METKKFVFDVCWWDIEIHDFGTHIQVPTVLYFLTQEQDRVQQPYNLILRDALPGGQF